MKSPKEVWSNFSYKHEGLSVLIAYVAIFIICLITVGLIGRFVESVGIEWAGLIFALLLLMKIGRDANKMTELHDTIKDKNSLIRYYENRLGIKPDSSSTPQ